MRAKILSLLKVYEEEISLLLWTTALLFVIRSSGMILNNYAETAFLKRYGVEYMPIVNMINAVVTFFVTGLLTAFLGKMSGARLLAHIFIFSGMSVTLIRLLIPFGFDLLYPILFMLKSQFELLQALLFWNMCNDLFNTRQSKRLFPLLTAGGVIGLILGSVGTPYFAQAFNLDNLLYVYLVTCLLGAVLVEAMALLQSRLGLEAAMRLAEDCRAFHVEWVDEATHEEAVRRLSRGAKRRVSLVDQVSFLVMKRRGVLVALAFDTDFEDEGFQIFGSGR